MYYIVVHVTMYNNRYVVTLHKSLHNNEEINFKNMGGFQLEFVSWVLSLVENLFLKKSFTRFSLQSECCNFNQLEALNHNRSRYF